MHCESQLSSDVSPLCFCLWKRRQKRNNEEFAQIGAHHNRASDTLTQTRTQLHRRTQSSYYLFLFMSITPCWGIFGLCGLFLSSSQYTSCGNVPLSIFPLPLLPLSVSVLSLHFCSLPVSLSLFFCVLLCLTQSLSPLVSLSSIPVSLSFLILNLSSPSFCPSPHLYLHLFAFLSPSLSEETEWAQ